MIGSANYLRANKRTHPNTKCLLDYSQFTLPKPTPFCTAFTKDNISIILRHMCDNVKVIDDDDLIFLIYAHYTAMFCGVHPANMACVITTNRVLYGWNKKPDIMLLHKVRIDKYNVGMGMNIGDTVVYRFDVGYGPTGKLPQCIQLGVICGKETPWISEPIDGDYDDNFRYDHQSEKHETSVLTDCTRDLTETNLLDVSTFAYRFNQINKKFTCYSYVACTYKSDKCTVDDGGFAVDVPYNIGPELKGRFTIAITKLESIGDISINFSHNENYHKPSSGPIYKPVYGNQQYWALMVSKGIDGRCSFGTCVFVHKSSEPYDQEIW